MAQVQVAFPRPVEEKITTPILDSMSKPVTEGEIIHWHFFSADNRIKSVRITFDDKHKFFPDEKTPNVYQKPFDSGTTIWGKAPDFRGKRTDCKYTVEAFGEKSNLVSQYDPIILVIDPNG